MSVYSHPIAYARFIATVQAPNGETFPLEVSNVRDADDARDAVSVHLPGGFHVLSIGETA